MAIIEGTNTADILNGTDGDDEISTGPGNDLARGLTGNDEIWGYTGNDTLSGGPGVDTIYGYTGDDQLSGGDNNDYLFPGEGSDHINGGDGDDYVQYSNQDVSITANLDTQLVTSASFQDTLTSIERIADAKGDDLLIGSSGNDIFSLRRGGRQ